MYVCIVVPASSPVGRITFESRGLVWMKNLKALTSKSLDRRTCGSECLHAGTQFGFLCFGLSYLTDIFTPQVDALKKKGCVDVDGRRYGVEVGKKADLSMQHTIDRSSGCGSRFPSPTLNIDRAKSAVRRIFGRWNQIKKAAEALAKAEVMCILRLASSCVCTRPWYVCDHVCVCVCFF